MLYRKYGKHKIKHLHQTPLKIPLPLCPQNDTAPLKTRFFSSKCRRGRKPKNEIDHQRYMKKKEEGKKRKKMKNKPNQKVYLREKKKSLEQKQH